QRLKRRLRALTVDGVRRSVDAGIEASGSKSGQLPAGRKTHHADAVRINTPFHRAASHETDRALNVSQRISFDGVRRTFFSRQPILQNETRDVAIAQPFGDVVSLMVHP